MGCVRVLSVSVLFAHGIASLSVALRTEIEADPVECRSFERVSISLAFPYAGANRIRFRGFDLRPLSATPRLPPPTVSPFRGPPRKGFGSSTAAGG
jgi:hypothetical protein